MSLTSNSQVALFISPHTDDAELGAGGFIWHLAQKQSVMILAFSTGDPSRGATIEEFNEAARCLGAMPATPLIPFGEKQHAIDRLELSTHLNRHTGMLFPTRRFDQHRQTICDTLFRFYERLTPALVVCPATTALHQDHQVINQECRRIFRECTLLGFDLPWDNGPSFSADYFVTLDPEAIGAKLDALQAYVSQAGRHYMDALVGRGLARARGAQIKTQYAEAFEVMRVVDLAARP